MRALVCTPARREKLPGLTRRYGPCPVSSEEIQGKAPLSHAFLGEGLGVRALVCTPARREKLPGLTRRYGPCPVSSEEIQGKAPLSHAFLGEGLGVRALVTPRAHATRRGTIKPLARRR